MPLGQTIRRWAGAFLIATGCAAARPNPLPELTAYARAHLIPIEGVQLARSGAAPRLGDSVTILVTESDPARSEQWIARLEAANPEPRPPRPPLKVYTVTGRQFEYPRQPFGIRVWLIGPFGGGSSASPDRLAAELAKPRLATVNGAFLDFGLDRWSRVAAQVGARVRAAGAHEEDYDFEAHPLSSDLMKRGQAFSLAAAMTPDEERTEIGGYLAFDSFVSVAERLPGVKSLLFHVVRLPSVWSVMRRMGISVDATFVEWEVKPVDARPLGVDLPAYAAPLRLTMNGQLAVQADFTVTAPRPPLEVCAGIVALQARHPADPAKCLTLELLAARCGSQ